MRNPILKGSLLIALGTVPAIGCGGGEGDQGGDIGKGGSSASSGSSGSSGKGNGGTAGVIPPGGTSFGGTTGGGTAGTLNSDTACVADGRTGNRATAALYFMVDISGSMNCPVPEADPPCETDPGNDPMPSRWTEASQAYKAFFSGVSAADNLWAGISFFSGNSCDPGDYGPEVEIDALPANAVDINAAIDGIDPNGNTPTVPSLTAAIDHARDWMGNHADHQGVVVYATDGYPRGCDQNNTIAEAVNVAADGLSGSPSVPTYVLAIGPNLTDLGMVATAGGTTVIQINTGQDVGAQLIAALEEIRDSVVIDCAYSIPAPPPGRALDYNQVNVQITSPGGNMDIPRDDPSDSTCDSGWQYSMDMTQILLCGSTCEAVQGDPLAGISVLFGCQTVIEPP